MYGSGNPLGAPAPPVPQLWPSNAVSMPSAVTPARMCAVADGRLPVSRCSSLRSSISFTGGLAMRASLAQMMPCASGPNLLPKPPPMYCVMHVDVGLRDARAPARMPCARLDHRLRRDPRGQLVAVPLARPCRASRGRRGRSRASSRSPRRRAPPWRSRRRRRRSLRSSPAACCRRETPPVHRPPSPARRSRRCGSTS